MVRRRGVNRKYVCTNYSRGNRPVPNFIEDWAVDRYNWFALHVSMFITLRQFGYKNYRLRGKLYD